MTIMDGACGVRGRQAFLGLSGCLIALAMSTGVAQEADAQTRPPARPPVAAQQAPVAVKEDPAAIALKADARNAALALCRDVRMYSETSRSPGALGESPALFSSVEPLCAEVGKPSVRKQWGTCYGKDGGHVFGTPCATHWWEPIWDGLSWCDDIKYACMAFGGTWESK